MKDIINKNKKYAYVALIIFIGLVILAYISALKQPSDNMAVEVVGDTTVMLAQANMAFQGSTEGTYDLQKADALYHQILQQDPTNEEALYQSARVHYVQGEYESSFNAIEKFKNLYPQNKRIHYVAGLANAYAGNLDSSIEEFALFVESDIVNEAGYLDLAWVYFKKSDFESAKIYLEEGIEKFGDNAWLNTSLGMTHFNLGNKEAALSLLNRAKEQADTITPEIWKINYSSNNPANYTKDIQKFKDIVAVNIALVQGDGDAVIDSKTTESIVTGLPFESLSSEGLSSGYAVSACCAASSGVACRSAKNICGQVNTGTNSCTGICSVTAAPANPTWTGADPSTECSTGTVTQTRCPGETRTIPGTKNCTPPATPATPVTTTPPASCTPGSYSPATSSVCSGTSFTQNNGCSSRTAYGTKYCPTACVPSAYSPSTSSVCSDKQFTQNNGCSSRTVWGTKNCVVPVNGQCNVKSAIAAGGHFCTAGTFENMTWSQQEDSEGHITAWEVSWACTGTGGGSSTSCGETWTEPPVEPPVGICSSRQGQSCNSPANICGETNTGIRGCNGFCSATTAPASPGWLGQTPSQVCEGAVAVQERCGDIQNFAGTKNCTVACTDTTWSGPSASSICSGIEFTQSKCGESRILVGTKACAAPVKKLNLECSVDKINWNDCSSVIKLSHSGVPFYVRNFVTTGGVSTRTSCATDIDLVGDASPNLPGLKFTKINNEYSQANITGSNVPSQIFNKTVFGACKYATASKDLTIKIINIDITEI